MLHCVAVVVHFSLCRILAVIQCVQPSVDSQPASPQASWSVARQKTACFQVLVSLTGQHLHPYCIVFMLAEFFVFVSMHTEFTRGGQQVLYARVGPGEAASQYPKLYKQCTTVFAPAMLVPVKVQF